MVSASGRSGHGLCASLIHHATRAAVSWPLKPLEAAQCPGCSPTFGLTFESHQIRPPLLLLQWLAYLLGWLGFMHIWKGMALSWCCRFLNLENFAAWNRSFLQPREACIFTTEATFHVFLCWSVKWSLLPTVWKHHGEEEEDRYLNYTPALAFGARFCASNDGIQKEQGSFYVYTNYLPKGWPYLK